MHLVGVDVDRPSNLWDVESIDRTMDANEATQAG
jgi:hypothetical protein